MNKYEKMKRNEEIKETLKKILHVVSYVLSVAFIVLMVIVGAQSCSNNKNNNVVTENKPLNSHFNIQKSKQENDLHSKVKQNALSSDFVIYECKFQGYNNLSYEQVIVPIFQYFNIDYLNPKSASSGAIFKNVHVGGQYTYRGELHDFDYIVFAFRVNEYNEEGIYYYRLDKINFYYNGGQKNILCDKNTSEAENTEYTFESGEIVLSDNYAYRFEETPLNLLFSKANKQSFVFEQNFNFNAPSLLPTGNQIWHEDSLSNDEWEVDHYSDLYLGWFYSNGELYDTIRYVYWSSDGQYFAPSVNDGDDPNGVGFYGVENYAFYVRMEYYNSVSHSSSIVNVRDRYWRSNASFLGVSMYFWTPTSTWRDNGYRSITLLTTLNDEQRILLNSFNNGSGAVVNTDVVTYTDMGNVFTLVGSAFTSILPVLNIVVLPGITLGILMFIPLVAMLVFAIIRIIKK